MANEDILSIEPVLNNTPNETVSEAINNINENTAESPFSEVKNYKLENQKKITISHFDVNLLRNKFISIEELIKSKLDIFLVCTTQIGQSFRNQQFSKIDIKHIIDIEKISVKAYHLQTQKWLILRLYQPPNQKEE